jgi:hypothetical protein
MINFNFSGLYNEGPLIFLPWFGLMFLRVLHYFNRYMGKEMGKFVIYLFLPLGTLEIIGHVIFLNEKIIFAKWPVFFGFGISFILATLFVESILKILYRVWLEIKYSR